MVSQEDLQRHRAAKMAQDEEQAGPGVAHGHLVGSADPDLMEVKGTLHGIFWKYQKELLFLFEVLCDNPYKWQTLRKRVQDIQNEQLRATTSLLHAAWMLKESEDADPES